MRIAVVASSFPRYDGDHAGVFVYHLARTLSQLGAGVVVLAPHDAGCPTREQLGSISVHRFVYVPKPIPGRLCYGSGIPDNLRSSKLAWGEVPCYAATLLGSLWRVIQAHRIDVVNSHWLLMQGLIAAVVHDITGTAHIATVHAGELSLLSRIPLRKSVLKYTLSRSSRVICVSQRTRAKLESLAGQSVEATILPMGIDTARFAAAGLSPSDARRLCKIDGDIVLLYVGRLAEKKGVSYLLDALSIIRQSMPGLQLIVVGSGGTEQSLRLKVRELGLGGSVRFVGRVANDELPAYYRSADLVVVPSIVSRTGDEEGMPVVVLEALAAGCRVVATRTGGTPEIIQDGRNGFLVEQANATSLAATLVRALTAVDAEGVSREAQRSVSDLDWGYIGKQYLALAEAAMTTRHGPT